MDDACASTQSPSHGGAGGVTGDSDGGSRSAVGSGDNLYSVGVEFRGGPGVGKSRMADELAGQVRAIAKSGCQWQDSASGSGPVPKEVMNVIQRPLRLTMSLGNGTSFLPQEKAYPGASLLALRTFFVAFIPPRLMMWESFFDEYRDTGMRFGDVLRCAVELHHGMTSSDWEFESGVGTASGSAAGVSNPGPRGDSDIPPSPTSDALAASSLPLALAVAVASGRGLRREQLEHSSYYSRAVGSDSDHDASVTVPVSARSQVTLIYVTIDEAQAAVDSSTLRSASDSEQKAM